MHTLLIVASLLLITVISVLVLYMLRGVAGWQQRRTLQLLVLVAPIISLQIGVHGLHDLTRNVCFVGIPPWDYLLELAVPLGMGLLTIGALGAGLFRLLLMARMVDHRRACIDPLLQDHMNRLAGMLDVPPPHVLVYAYNRPIALTYGLQRPTVLLSSGLLDQLDHGEIEAVLAHELGHVVRRDYLVMWLATVLRDMFWYLPTSRRIYTQIQREKELAADDLAISATRRPLALASALAKVWHQALLGTPVAGGSQALVSAGTDVEARIKRLLMLSETAQPVTRPPRSMLDFGSAMLVTIVVIGTADIVLKVVEPVGCAPIVFGLLMW